MKTALLLLASKIINMLIKGSTGNILSYSCEASYCDQFHCDRENWYGIFVEW